MKCNQRGNEDTFQTESPISFLHSITHITRSLTLTHPPNRLPPRPRNSSPLRANRRAHQRPARPALRIRINALAAPHVAPARRRRRGHHPQAHRRVPADDCESRGALRGAGEGGTGRGGWGGGGCGGEGAGVFGGRGCEVGETGASGSAVVVSWDGVGCLLCVMLVVQFYVGERR